MTCSPLCVCYCGEDEGGSRRGEPAVGVLNVYLCAGHGPRLPGYLPGLEITPKGLVCTDGGRDRIFEWAIVETDTGDACEDTGLQALFPCPGVEASRVCSQVGSVVCFCEGGHAQLYDDQYHNESNIYKRDEHNT